MQFFDRVGFPKVYNLNYQNMGLIPEIVNEMIHKISLIFKEYEPKIIHVMNRSDVHSDHRFTFVTFASCTKTFRYPLVKEVLMYESISEIEFEPMLLEKGSQTNYFVAFSDFFKKKIEILQIYLSELGEHPFLRRSRNIEALAVHRGASIETEYAEAFQLIKFLDK